MNKRDVLNLIRLAIVLAFVGFCFHSCLQWDLEHKRMEIENEEGE